MFIVIELQYSDVHEILSVTGHIQYRYVYGSI